MTQAYRTNLKRKTNCVKSYIFNNEEYYKVKGIKDSFYIKVSDYEKITIKQVAITIYQYTLDGLKKIKGFVKTVVTEGCELLLIAGPKISAHFRIYNLERE